MSKKVSELESDEKKMIENQMENISSQMGMDAWESYGTNEQIMLQDQIGICFNCKNLNYCMTEFGKVFAKCSHFEFRLNGQNRITDCNCHSPKGVLSLNEMYSMAYLIEPNDEKIEGFVSKNPRLLKKKESPCGRPLNFNSTE